MPYAACMQQRRQLCAGGIALVLAPSTWAQPPGTPPGPPREDRNDRERRDPRQRYSLQQAMSDKAQLHTIAFSGLAFLSGDFAADTFLPPGKIADFFGFQYLRDIDAAGGGHNPAFLTRIAFNMLDLLTPAQAAQFVELAALQEAELRRFALMRLPLMRALRRQLEGQVPQGSAGLDHAAVIGLSASLYDLDGRLTVQRAQVMARVYRSFSAEQLARLARLQFGDSRTWPEVAEPAARRGLNHAQDVAVMTYASEMFAWVRGSLEADTYFCPERHAMYFGGFGLKTAPAMGKKDYAISTALTGEAGAEFLALLDPEQRNVVAELPQRQRAVLQEIAAVRLQIATELRRLLAGQAIDESRVLAASHRYGELDGELAWLYAQAFIRVGRSLSAAQRDALSQMRARSPHGPNDPKGPFLFAAPLDRDGLAQAERVNALFGLPTEAGR